jgi:membrane protease YdiL (CAAX protease family)
MSTNPAIPSEVISNNTAAEFFGSRRSAVLALLLLLPAPTIGVSMMLLVFPEGSIGKIIQAIMKVWLLILPVAWWILIDKQKASFPKPSLKGMGAGVGTGVFIFAAMIGAFFLFRSQIDVTTMQEKAKATGFDQPMAYIGIFIYLITINSLLEEYVWRWFVFRKSEALSVGWFGRRWGGWIAAVAAGLFFTVHHVFALAAWVPPMIVVLASIGVFVGGATWSALYFRYRSIWPGYVSHVFADIAIFIMGWELIFGF